MRSSSNQSKYLGPSQTSRAALLGYRDPAPTGKEGIYKKLYEHPSSYVYYPPTFDQKPLNTLYGEQQRSFDQGNLYKDNSFQQIPQKGYPNGGLNVSYKEYRGKQNPTDGNQMAYSNVQGLATQNNSMFVPNAKANNNMQGAPGHVVSPTFASIYSQTVIPRWPVAQEANRTRNPMYFSHDLQRSQGNDVNNNQYYRPQANNYDSVDQARQNYEMQQRGYGYPQAGVAETQVVRPRPVEEQRNVEQVQGQQYGSYPVQGNDNNLRAQQNQQNRYQEEASQERQRYNNNVVENQVDAQAERPQDTNNGFQETNRQVNASMTQFPKYDPFKREDKLYGQHAPTYNTNISYPW